MKGGNQMEKMFKEIMKKLDSIDEKIDTLSGEVKVNRKEITGNRKIMQHCFGDVYEQHDKAYKKLNTIEKEISRIDDDVDSLLSKTSRNSQKIRKLDEELNKAQ
ncbi:MAG: hypothetical protein N4A68_17075 [Maledivibacter sp.]|nr:hypothetical protein [Maledivibacter sp.]